MKKLSLTVATLFILSLRCFGADVAAGIYVINLGRFVLTDGSYYVDFYLTFTQGENNEILDKIKYEFMNGKAESIDLVDEAPGKKVYRVKANLSIPVDLREFPFEEHAIKIAIEDKVSTKDSINFVPEKSLSGIDPEVFIPGYSVRSWDLKAREHYYGAFDETYSQLVFTIDISKPIWNAFQKTLLPVIFMVLIVLLSFLMNSKMVGSRLSIATSGLLGAVMFHSSIAGQLPPIGYLTVADKVMILTYAIILISAVISIIMLDEVSKGKTDAAEKLYAKTRYRVFVFCSALFFIALYLLIRE